jgi:hypothetical protein
MMRRRFPDLRDRAQTVEVVQDAWIRRV